MQENILQEKRKFFNMIFQTTEEDRGLKRIENLFSHNKTV